MSIFAYEMYQLATLTCMYVLRTCVVTETYRVKTSETERQIYLLAHTPVS